MLLHLVLSLTALGNTPCSSSRRRRLPRWHGSPKPREQYYGGRPNKGPLPLVNARKNYLKYKARPKIVVYYIINTEYDGRTACGGVRGGACREKLNTITIQLLLVRNFKV
jgi:hypothetical protein